MRKTCAGYAALALIAVAELSVHGQPKPGVEPENATQQLVILDTDIGDDIDDAFALALLLQSPEIKLLGITTAFGDTELRARLVERYLAAVDRSGIPVEAGVATPAANHFTQAAYARQAPERQHEDAIGFLLREIKAHPGQITLIAIGPPGELGAILAHGSALSDQLTLLYHQWTGADAWRMPTLFDPVAASYAIRPELCPMKPMRLEVDDQGFTKPGPGEPNAQVCLKADEQGFREFLLKRILDESEK